MKRSFLIAMGVVAALGLSGCKIVFDEEKDAAAIPDGPDGDNARNTARICVLKNAGCSKESLMLRQPRNGLASLCV